jgi:hypothetical protein
MKLKHPDLLPSIFETPKSPSFIMLSIIRNENPTFQKDILRFNIAVKDILRVDRPDSDQQLTEPLQNLLLFKGFSFQLLTLYLIKHRPVTSILHNDVQIAILFEAFEIPDDCGAL